MPAGKNFLMGMAVAGAYSSLAPFLPNMPRSALRALIAARHSAAHSSLASPVIWWSWNMARERALTPFPFVRSDSVQDFVEAVGVDGTVEPAQERVGISLVDPLADRLAGWAEFALDEMQ